jgi:hypothetical protein
MPASLAAGFADSLELDALFETVTGLFAMGDFLAQPDHVLEVLSGLTVTWAMIFIIAGSLCLVNGYRLYKAVTIGLALLIGMFGGYALGGSIGVPYIVAACAGLLLAVVAMPLMKYAVALFGGLMGAFIGANLWSGVADALQKGADVSLPGDMYWIGALIGLILSGMLAFILFKLAVVLMASVTGATLVVLGTIAMLLTFEPVRQPMIDALTANRVVIPLLVFVPAAIALVWQETQKGQPADPSPKPAKPVKASPAA